MDEYVLYRSKSKECIVFTGTILAQIDDYGVGLVDEALMDLKLYKTSQGNYIFASSLYIPKIDTNYLEEVEEFDSAEEALKVLIFEGEEFSDLVDELLEQAASVDQEFCQLWQKLDQDDKNQLAIEVC